jgi:hypothetical protein
MRNDAPSILFNDGECRPVRIQVRSTKPSTTKRLSTPLAQKCALLVHISRYRRGAKVRRLQRSSRNRPTLSDRPDRGLASFQTFRIFWRRVLGDFERLADHAADESIRPFVSFGDLPDGHALEMLVPPYDPADKVTQVMRWQIENVGQPPIWSPGSIGTFVPDGRAVATGAIA